METPKRQRAQSLPGEKGHSPKKHHKGEGSPKYGSDLHGVRLGEGPEWKLGGRIEDLDYCSAKKMAAGSGDAATGKVLACDPDQNPAGTVDQLMHFQGLCSMLLEQALNCSELADVRFVFDDGKSMLSGHRSVLCSASETFRGMFRSGMREARTGEVHVRGVSRRSFRGFLEWLYLGCGGIETTMSDGRELWVLAEMHDVQALKRWLLNAAIDSRTVGPVMQFALEAPYGRKDVVTACLEDAALGFEGMCEGDMRGVSFHTARELLVAYLENSKEKLSVRELKGFQCAQSWCNANGVSLHHRSDCCEGLMNLLDFGKLRSKDLLRVIKPSGLVAAEEVDALHTQRVNTETLGDAVFSLDLSYGSHGSGPGQFGASIRGVAVHGRGDKQRIAACDRINHRVHIFSTATRQLLATIGSEGKGNGEFVFPVGAAFNEAGDLFVSDMVLGRMQVFDRNGHFLRAFASRGRGDGELQNPYGVAVNSKGYVHVCDGWNNRIQVFSGEGVWVKSYGKKGSGEAQFSHPGGIAIGPDDSVVVADSGNSRVQVLSSTGEFVRMFGTEGNGNGCFQTPSGIAVGARGEILVTDRGRKDIQVFDWSGEYLQTIGQEGESMVEIECPWGLAVDGDCCIFVGDIGSVHRMRDME